MESEALVYMETDGSKTDFRSVRHKSLQLAEAIGYRTNPTLPLLEEYEVTRTSQDIACRALVLLACCAVSYGFSCERATAWILSNDLSRHATPEEITLLNGGFCDPQFKLRPEAMWALAWVIGKAEAFELYTPMPQDAVYLFPDLHKLGGAEVWMESASVRDSCKVVEALDFYYCLHWALRDGVVSKKIVQKFPGFAVVERRRALEWCLGTMSWDEISLDT